MEFFSSEEGIVISSKPSRVAEYLLRMTERLLYFAYDRESPGQCSTTSI
jgi:hypothetical protein